MSDILSQPIVLSLNAAWQRIGIKSVQQAIVAMNSSPSRDGEDLAAHGMNIEYELREDGSYNFDNPLHIFPVKWKDWIELPIRPYDNVIHCSGDRKIRVPTCVIATHYHKMPKKQKRLSKKNIYERDGGICQYSRRKLSRKEGTVDHVIPKSRGGKDSWENLVLCDAALNFAKGNKNNKEAGLSLIREPKAPMPVPVSAFITEARVRDWKMFMD